jgi:Tol biopolymer transport system component
MGGNVNYLQYTPDGVHIVYLVSQIGGNTNELFSILADGSGAPVPLSNSGNFRIMPDGKNVIYAAGLADGSGISALYEIGIDGGKPVLLAQNPYSSGLILPWGEGWQISADGRLLVFTADDGSAEARFLRWRFRSREFCYWAERC